MQNRQAVAKAPAPSQAVLADSLNDLLSLLQQSILQCNYMLDTAAEPLKERLATLRDLHVEHADTLSERIVELGATPVKVASTLPSSSNALTDTHVAERLLLPYCQQEQEIVNRCSDQLYLVIDSEALTALLQRIREQTRSQLLSLFTSRRQ